MNGIKNKMLEEDEKNGEENSEMRKIKGENYKKNLG